MHRFRIAALAVGLMLGACTLQVGVIDEGTPAPAGDNERLTQPLTQQADDSRSEPEPPAPIGQPASEPGDEAASPVESWVIYITTQPKNGAEDSLHALNPATGQVTTLWDFTGSGEMLHAPDSLQEGISPDGHYMAFVSGTAQSLDGLTLRVVTIPEGTLIEAIALTTASTDEDAKPVIASHGEYLTCYDACASTPGGTSLAWSPDGQHLAFMGAMEGPSSDLYVYTLADDSVIRLTDGPSQATTPFWTPDSRLVLHAALDVVDVHEDRPEYAQEEWGIVGVWSAGLDGGPAGPQYRPDDSIAEFFVGWVTDTIFISHSWQFGCGAHALRQVILGGGITKQLWQGAFEEIALAQTFNTLLLDNSGLTPDCLGEDYPGTYAVDSFNWGMNVIAPESGEDLRWSENGQRLFAAVPEIGEITAINPQQEQEFYPAPLPTTPLVAPGGRYWAWWTPEPGIGNLQITPAGGGEAQVFDSGAVYALWLPRPDSPALVAFTIDSIVVLEGANFQQRTLVEGISVENLRYGAMTRFTPGVAHQHPSM